LIAQARARRKNPSGNVEGPSMEQVLNSRVEHS
jgi:hypothetical protein